MTAFFGIAALISFFTGMFCFGWAVHASLNHRLSIFGWSFDKDESSLPFHRAVLAISLLGIIAIATSFYALIGWLDLFVVDL